MLHEIRVIPEFAFTLLLTAWWMLLLYDLWWLLKTPLSKRSMKVAVGTCRYTFGDLLLLYILAPGMAYILITASFITSGVMLIVCLLTAHWLIYEAHRILKR